MKCILHVELAKRPRSGDGKAKDHTDHAGLDNGTKSLIKIDAGLLGVATYNPTCLISRECAVGVKFVAKHPLACDNVGSGRLRDKAPGVILDKGGVLLAHGVSPLRISESCTICRRNWRKRGGGNEIEAGGRNTKTGLGSGCHGVGVGRLRN